VGLEGVVGVPAQRFDGADAAASLWRGSHGGGRAAAGAGRPKAGPRSARVAGRAEDQWPVDQHPASVAYAAAAWSATQKKSIHATERDTEANRIRRQAFVAELRTIAPEDLIYLDESGVSTQMARPYARAPRGQRVHATVPGGNWKMLTILGAMDHNGMLAAMTVEAATDSDVFFAYLENVLCPKLRPGHVVVMDNLSVHKVDGVRQRIEATGARVLYLPPYSPDLNPIEKLWSKLKKGLQNAAARTADALHDAVANLLPTITSRDAKAWFRLPYAAYL
jgi:transposase